MENNPTGLKGGIFLEKAMHPRRSIEAWCILEHTFVSAGLVDLEVA
jgi:hypothetical protein